MDLIVFFAVGVVVGVCLLVIGLRHTKNKPDGLTARYLSRLM